MPENEEARIVSGIFLEKENVKLSSRYGKVLRAQNIGRSELPHTQVVGGDSENPGGPEGSPSIIIEREGERMKRIMVKCPCGRHAELLCEYGEGS